MFGLDIILGAFTFCFILLPLFRLRTSFISSGETDDFAKHLGQWEPLNALFANNNGLAEYMIISRSLSKVMKTSGVALFEIGYNQSRAVSEIFKNCGYKISIFKDMSGKDRVIKVTF